MRLYGLSLDVLVIVKCMFHKRAHILEMKLVCTQSHIFNDQFIINDSIRQLSVKVMRSVSTALVRGTRYCGGQGGIVFSARHEKMV